MTHPSIIIILSVIFLYITKNKNKFAFKSVAIMAPILAAISIFFFPEYNEDIIFNINFIQDAAPSMKLLSIGVCIILLCANIYSLGQKRINEIILGNAYGAFCILCLFAGDFISMFIALELMMIASSAIIFIGGMRASIRATKTYLITHLCSSQMILIGIAYIIINTNSTKIINVIDLMNNAAFATFPICLLLVGLLINIACLPFAGWMVKCYTKASPCGFLYLICFTTKISFILIVKLFAGYIYFSYIGLFMVIYSMCRAIYETSIYAILCYLSMTCLGMLLAVLAFQTDTESINKVLVYIFIHMLYKTLLSLCFAICTDKTDKLCYNDMPLLGNKILSFGFFMSCMMMISFPATETFYIKEELLHLLPSNLATLFLIMVSFSYVVSMPFKNFVPNKNSQQIILCNYTKISLIMLIFSLLIINIFNDYFLSLFSINITKTISIYSKEGIAQFLAISLSIIFAYFIPIKKLHTNPSNLIELAGQFILYMHKKYVKRADYLEQHRETLAGGKFETYFSSKVKAMSNQNTAIFVACLFMVCLSIILLSK